METQIENIKSQGRDKVIEIAYNIINDKHPTIELLAEDYDISMWANSKDVVVKFRRQFKYYYPQKEGLHERTYRDLIYDISVNLINQYVSPLDDCFLKERFYISSEEEKERIAFVKKHADIIITHNCREYDIYEYEEHYDFYSRLNSSFINFKIDKITGENYDRNELNATPAVTPKSLLSAEDPLTRIF
ncbi:hypothetical protein C9994_03080 [Marivirga lumbricoides]|uniref:Uncharacterized protein n=1 Tax=Marivirga lumbricoides TaxID=1046115 RepID=A0A2T4DUA7_9BACT|nr:hypothetical protein C9994_03080 [Marivirga lumbricoides]